MSKFGRRRIGGQYTLGAAVANNPAATHVEPVPTAIQPATIIGGRAVPAVQPSRIIGVRPVACNENSGCYVPDNYVQTQALPNQINTGNNGYNSGYSNGITNDDDCCPNAQQHVQSPINLTVNVNSNNTDSEDTTTTVEQPVVQPHVIQPNVFQPHVIQPYLNPQNVMNPVIIPQPGNTEYQTVYYNSDGQPTANVPAVTPAPVVSVTPVDSPVYEDLYRKVIRDGATRPKPKPCKEIFYKEFI